MGGAVSEGWEACPVYDGDGGTLKLGGHERDMYAMKKRNVRMAANWTGRREARRPTDAREEGKRVPREEEYPPHGRREGRGLSMLSRGIIQR